MLALAGVKLHHLVYGDSVPPFPCTAGAAIKALGRWGGSTVERYIGDAAIGTVVEVAKSIRVQQVCCLPAEGLRVHGNSDCTA
eukprot:6207689-Amphidinium_carterae.1